MACIVFCHEELVVCRATGLIHVGELDFSLSLAHDKLVSTTFFIRQLSLKLIVDI